MTYVQRHVEDERAVMGHVAAMAAVVAHPATYAQMEALPSNLWWRLDLTSELFGLGMVGIKAAHYNNLLRVARRGWRNLSDEQLAIVWGLHIMGVARATGVDPSAQRMYGQWERAAQRFGNELGGHAAVVQMSWPQLYMRLREELCAIQTVTPQQVRAFWDIVYAVNSPLVSQGRVASPPNDVRQWICTHLPTRHLGRLMGAQLRLRPAVPGE